MSIVFLSTKLPILNINEKPKINKQTLLKYILENKDSIKEKETDLFLLNEEITLLQKNFSFSEDIKKKKNIKIKNYTNLNYDSPILYKYEIDIKNKKIQEIKRYFYKLAEKQTDSSLFKEWIEFVSNFKDCLLGILLEKQNCEEKTIKEELLGSETEAAIIIKNNNKSIINSLNKKNSYIQKINELINNKKFYDLEIYIEKIKWEKINKISEINDIFSINFLYQYYYKIIILERLNSFNIELGEKIFEKILIN